jgi:hypothetical protein
MLSMACPRQQFDAYNSKCSILLCLLNIKEIHNKRKTDLFKLPTQTLTVSDRMMIVLSL